jgi:uncharacterized protein
LQEQLKTLYELQQIDQQVDQLKKESTKIPDLIQEMQTRIESKQALVEQKQAGLKNLAKKRRDKESDLAQREERISSEKTKLMGVKTNKEYHAVEKEIENSKEAKSVLEEEILLLLEETEQYEVELKQAKARVNGRVREIEAEVADVKKRAAAIPPELKGLMEQRAKREGQIDANLKKRYEQTRVQRGGQAVAFVEKGVCLGCRLSIPPQTFNLIQRNEEIFTCPNCYRILYYPGEAVHNDIDL